MSAADADDKKDEKWPERVTFRKLVVNPKEKFFLADVEDVKAKFVQLGKKDKQDAWRLDASSARIAPTDGSEIVSTDKDGNKTTWVVTKAHVLHGDDYHLCEVKKKDAKP